MRQNLFTRRQFVGASSVVALGSVAGCTGAFGGNTGGNPESASFTFEYAPEDQRLTVTHDGGGAVPAAALSIRSSAGTSVGWSELGSTTESSGDVVEEGANAVLGPDIINWGRPVTRTELIRVVFTQEDGSVTTLGRFESELTTTPGPTSTATRTSEQGVIYSDDFEDGTLAEYDVVTYPAKRSGGSFSITTAPSRGTYAVQLDTTNKYLKPTTAPALEPPLTFSMDFYVHRSAGVDIALQYDSERNAEYVVKLRNNINGNFVEVNKHDRNYRTGSTTDLKASPQVPGAFTQQRWETVTITWANDGTITAEVASSGKSASIRDTELSGNPFHILGYHYSGWAVIDNIRIER